MGTVFDTPVIAHLKEDPLGTGLIRGLTGDAIDTLQSRRFVFFGDLAFDEPGLADMGKPEVVIERRGSADTPALDAPMAAIEGLSG